MIQHICPLRIEKKRKERQILFHGDFACNAYANDFDDYPTRSIPLHWHPEFELIKPLTTTIRVIASEDELLIAPGELCFINSNALHGIISDTSGECICHSLVFGSELIAGTAGSIYDRKYLRPLIDSGQPLIPLTDSHMSQFFSDGFKEMENEDPGYEFAVRSILSTILFHIIKKLPAAESHGHVSERENRMKQMLEWFDEHYAEDFSVQALADYISYSPRECERTFQAILHTSPKAYLTKRRIMAAIDLIENTNRSMLDIACTCGFSNQSHFAKQFKKITGRSPSSYRIG